MGSRDDLEQRTLSLSGLHQTARAAFAISEREPRDRDVNLQLTTTHLTIFNRSSYLSA